MNHRQSKKGRMKHGEYKACKESARKSWSKLIEECKKQSGKIPISAPDPNYIVIGKSGRGKAFYSCCLLNTGKEP